MASTKYLLIARHGTYDETTGNLDEHGILVSRQMANRLKDGILKNLKFKILYSPTPRTSQTANIYAETLGVDKSLMIPKYELKELNYHCPDRLSEAVGVLESEMKDRTTDACLFITHENTGIDAIQAFREKKFGLETTIDHISFSWVLIVDTNPPYKLSVLHPKFIPS